MKNIVETAIDDGHFTTLVKAVQAADLVDTLSGPGPFTVFAPTDGAFSKLPSGMLDSVLQRQRTAYFYTDLSRSVRKVHWQVTRRSSNQLRPFREVSQGRSSSPVSRGVKIDDAQVIHPDIECTNGCDPRN